MRSVVAVTRARERSLDNRVNDDDLKVGRRVQAAVSSLQRRGRTTEVEVVGRCEGREGIVGGGGV